MLKLTVVERSTVKVQDNADGQKFPIRLSDLVEVQQVSVGTLFHGIYILIGVWPKEGNCRDVAVTDQSQKILTILFGEKSVLFCVNALYLGDWPACLRSW